MSGGSGYPAPTLELFSVRVDRWLCAARIFKTRSLAQTACEGGHVRVNGTSVKPSHSVRVGDKVSAQSPRGLVVLEVLGLEAKRQSPETARALYEDHSPPPPPPEERMAQRDRGAGRPTKADRRALERVRGEHD